MLSKAIIKAGTVSAIVTYTAFADCLTTLCCTTQCKVNHLRADRMASTLSRLYTSLVLQVATEYAIHSSAGAMSATGFLESDDMAKSDFLQALRLYIRHYKMVSGKTNAAIAKQCGISLTTLGRLKRDTNPRRHWATIAGVLQALAPEALPNAESLKLGVKGSVTPKARRRA
jgi:hypothetical protein